MKARFGSSLLLAGLLAACGGTAAAPSASPASPAATAASSAAASKPAAAPASASAPASAPAAASGAASGPIKVGVLEPLTGVNANTGKDNEDGFNLYLESIHNTVAGRTIEPTFADAQAQADVALTKAKQLVDSTKVQLLMGVTVTPACYALAPYVKQVQVPLAVTGNCGAEGLTTDPKIKSEWVTRFTQTTTGLADPAADWTYKNGYRKAILITADFGGGLEWSDFYASAFIKRGGSIVQEIHPAVGTSDYGPFLGQLTQNADVVAVFLIGADALRFAQQYSDYAGQHKLPVLDLGAQITNGPNLSVLKQAAVGIVSNTFYSSAIDSQMNQAFLKAWQAKYPGRLVSSDAAQGYAGAQVLEAAVKKVNGRVEQKQDFLNALYAVDLETAKGPVKLDSDHDVVENYYVYQTVADGSSFGQKLLQTYTGVSKYWDRTPQEVQAYAPFGKFKGKWVGMTKDKLDQLVK